MAEEGDALRFIAAHAVHGERARGVVLMRNRQRKVAKIKSRVAVAEKMNNGHHERIDALIIINCVFIFIIMSY